MKGKSMKNTLVFCLALIFVIAMSSCAQPSQLVHIELQGISRTVTPGTSIDTWLNANDAGVKAWYSDGTMKNLAVGQVNSVLKYRQTGTNNWSNVGSFDKAGSYEFTVTYEGKSDTTEVTAAVTETRIPLSVDIVYKKDTCEDTKKDYLIPHDFVWFQPLEGYVAPVENTIFNPQELELYVTVEFADGSRIWQEKMSDLVEQGKGVARYFILLDDSNSVYELIPGKTIAGVNELYSGTYDLGVTYEHNYGPVASSSGNRRSIDADQQNPNAWIAWVEAENSASAQFEDTVILNFYYPVTFYDHLDIQDTKDQTLTTCFTLPDSVFSDNIMTGEACENHFKLTDLSGLEKQSITAKPPQSANENMFGYVWLRDIAELTLTEQTIVNPSRTTVDPSHIVFEFSHWLHANGSQEDTPSSFTMKKISNWVKDPDLGYYIPLNNKLYADYSMVSDYGSQNSVTTIPAGFKFPYLGSVNSSITTDYKVAQEGVQNKTWVETLVALNGSNGKSYRGYELDKATKMEIPYADTTVVQPDGFNQENYKSAVQNSVKVARPILLRETASTDMNIGGKDGNSMRLITVTYTDPLYNSTTPQLSYIYRLFIGSGTPSGSTVSRLAFADDTQSIYEAGSQADNIISAGEKKVKAYNFKNELVNGVIPTVLLLDKGGNSITGTVDKGHYILKASYEISGSGTVVATYAITVDPIISDAAGVDKDIIPERLVVVDSEVSVMSDSLPTRKQWEYATRFQIEKTSGLGSDGKYAFAYFDTQAETSTGLGLVLTTTNEWVEDDVRDAKTVGGKEYTVLKPLLMDRANNSLTTAKPVIAGENPTADYRLIVSND